MHFYHVAKLELTAERQAYLDNQLPKDTLPKDTLYAPNQLPKDTLYLDNLEVLTLHID
jgi:hypothetical protein